MSERAPIRLPVIPFETRDEARRRAVEHPADVDAVIAGSWPPFSRAEIKDLPRKLARALTPRDKALGEYLLRRVARARLAIRNREVRHGGTGTWTATAANGRTIRFPINDPVSTDFKTMVDDYDGRYEGPLIAFISEHLSPGDVFVDVGANVGYVSAFAAAIGASVFALEIQRDVIPLIEQLATINAFDRLRVLHVGASARSGLAMMPRIEGNPGTQLDGAADRPAERILRETRSLVDDFVPMMALDDLFLDPQLLPKLVKIDVEGHEIGVLEGARRIIGAGRTTFVVEFHPHLVALYRRDAAELLAPFDRDRWSTWQLDDDGLRPIAGLDDIRPDPRDPNPKLVFEPKFA